MISAQNLNTHSFALITKDIFEQPSGLKHQQLLHSCLARFNRQRLQPCQPSAQWQENLATELECKLLEGQFLEQLRLEIAPSRPKANCQSDDFVAWFESLLVLGAGQHHPLFDFLATEANIEQMTWFLTQEIAGEAGFEDLLAYTQVKLPPRAKLEFARNYWDEMGRGKQEVMHGLLLERMAQELQLQPDIDETVWQSLALNNMMVGLALTRSYAYQSIGALGVIELTAPSRALKVSAGMRRLGFSQKMRAYFDLHAAIDILHSRAWLKEVIKPLVEDSPSCAVFIAEGALMRLLCGQRCFDRYQQEFALFATSTTKNDNSHEYFN